MRVDAFMKIIARVLPARGVFRYSPRRMRSARSNSARSSAREKSGIARKSRWGRSVMTGLEEWTFRKPPKLTGGESDEQAIQRASPLGERRGSTGFGRVTAPSIERHTSSSGLSPGPRSPLPIVQHRNTDGTARPDGTRMVAPALRTAAARAHATAAGRRRRAAGSDLPGERHAWRARSPKSDEDPA